MLLHPPFQWKNNQAIREFTELLPTRLCQTRGSRRTHVEREVGHTSQARAQLATWTRGPLCCTWEAAEKMHFSCWKVCGRESEAFCTKSSRYRRSLFFSDPRANPGSCDRLHGCQSHMTSISHGSRLATHYISLIGWSDRLLLHISWLAGIFVSIPRGQWSRRVDVLLRIGTTWEISTEIIQVLLQNCEPDTI